MSRQTSFLLVHSDQHRWDCLGVNGHPLVRTPAIDALASQGVNFRHAYCPIPLCTPARTSLLSGSWPTTHGCLANPESEAFQPMVGGTPVFPALLRDGGFRLGYVGKWHVDNARDPRGYGFDDYVESGAYWQWRAEQGIARVASEGGGFVLPQASRGFSALFGGTDDSITAEQSRLHWEADRTIELLRSYAAGKQPFFLRWDPVEPHLPNYVPEPYASMYDPADIPPWPSYPDAFVGKPYIQAQQQRTWGVADFTWADWAPTVARYLGEISLLDHEVGRIVDALDESGRDDIAVIYTTDHGDMCGAHGHMDKHYVMYDDVMRVPLIVRWPGEFQAGTTIESYVVHSIDLARTFLDAAGCEAPGTFQGADLRAIARGELDRERPDVFGMYFGNQMGLYSQRMVRDHRWKYVWNAVAEDELYDLEADAGELVNRATDVVCTAELARLRGRMAAWMEGIGDPLRPSKNPWIAGQLLDGRTV